MSRKQLELRTSSGHLADRIEVEVHTDAADFTHAVVISLLSYSDGEAIWHPGRDSAGDIDVAAIELDTAALPAAVALRAFTSAHLQHWLQEGQDGHAIAGGELPAGLPRHAGSAAGCAAPAARRR